MVVPASAAPSLAGTGLTRWALRWGQWPVEWHQAGRVPGGAHGAARPLFSITQGLALTHVREQNLKPRAGPRPEAAKVVILVTDGKSQDDARAAGRVLKDLGVAIFAVGEQPPAVGWGSHSRWGSLHSHFPPRAGGPVVSVPQGGPVPAPRSWEHPRALGGGTQCGASEQSPEFTVPCVNGPLWVCPTHGAAGARRPHDLILLASLATSYLCPLGRELQT